MKSLVIYFSRTGENYMEDGIRNINEGNTEIVAKKISEIIGADLFKVEPVKEYPYNYQECCDKAKKELEENKKPDIKKSLSNLDGYDIIYIGGPVWWGHYPCCLLTQLESLDFSGKIIKPFTTHEGSGLGNIMEDINKYCKNGIIKNGLAIRGCEANNSTVKLESWCKND